jgi:hypothetical protein
MATGTYQRKFRGSGMILDTYQPRTGDDYDRWSPPLADRV